MIYNFGPFTANADLFELSKNGAVLAVEPMVFNVLLWYLLNPVRGRSSRVGC